MRNLCLAAWVLSVNPVFSQLGPERVLVQPPANGPMDALLTDIDGNGSADIVSISANDDRLAWYANDGTGQCGPQQTITTHARGVENIAYGDLDGDGDADLLTASGTDNAVAWYRNDGQGHFSPALVIDGSALNASHTNVADLDGDGDLDAVVAWVDGVSWYANDGNGNYGTAQLIATVYYLPTATAVADMDSDGDADVIAVGFGFTQWYRNTGAGIFDTTFNVPGASYIDNVTVGDLDGDADPDLIGTNECNGKAVWYPNDGSGIFPEQLLITTNAYSSCEGNSTVEVGDADGDGDLDVVVGYFDLTAMNTAHQPWIYLNDGSGTFTASASLPFNHETQVSAVRIGDLDGDPIPDLVIAMFDNRLYSWNLPLGSFNVLQTLSGSSTHVMITKAGDLNGDGRTDLVSATTPDRDLTDFDFESAQVWWQAQDPAGNFGERIQIGGGGSEITVLELQDIDADGDLDVFYCFKQNEDPIWLRNDGLGNFISQQVVQMFQIIEAANLGDMDGDGDLDAVIPYYDNNDLNWYEFLDSSFSSVPHPVHISAPYLRHVLTGDLDGDGDQDVIKGQLTLNWQANDGTGVFGAATAIPLPGQVADAFLADIDGDGDLDIAGSQNMGPVGWCANDGSGTFGVFQQIGFVNDALRPVRIAQGDFNNDGHPDVLYETSTEDQVGWILNINGGQFWEQYVLSTTAASPWDVSVADMDGDGDDDALASCFGGSRVSEFENYTVHPYSLEGRVFVDQDADGVENGDDVGAGFAAIGCMPAPAFEFSDANGDYVAHVDSGVHVLAFNGAPLWDLTTDSTAYHVLLSAQQPISTQLDFGIHAAMDSSHVIVAYTSGQGVCGAVVPQWIDISNAGTREEHGYVAVRLDSLYTLMGTLPAPDSTVGHTSYWNLDTLACFEHLTIWMQVLSPDVTHEGDTAITSTTVQLLDTQGQPTGTVEESWIHPISCSYDPNDKSVVPIGTGDFHIVNTPIPYLDYTIRFQNTGSATAYTITLTDELSLLLEPSSLQVTGYSHPPSEVCIEPDGTLIVRFSGIMLPDSATDPIASQGFFRFRIRPDADLPGVSSVLNTANIYFDLNAPVTTNTTLTTLVDCEVFSATINLIDVDLFQASEAASYQWYLDGAAIPGATAQELLVGATGYYSVAIVSAYGCVRVSDPVQVVALRVPADDAFRMVLLPNPFSDAARVLFSEPVGPHAHLELMDMSGRSLRTMKGNGTRELLIERRDLANGVYLLRLTGIPGPPAVVRLVVE